MAEPQTWLGFGEDDEADGDAGTQVETAQVSPPPELLELLGRGGTAEVWRAWDPVLDREVACKVLAIELCAHFGHVSRFHQEAGATARLQHPGIVAVHTTGYLADGRPYFTMQEVRGRPMSDMVRGLDRRDALAARRLVEVLHRASEILAYAHDRGVLHRDFKPANVMVGDFGEVRVIDWGLLKELSAIGPAVHGGTPAYMAPEQARGEPLTPAADVYAMGATLFEVLSGAPPHPGLGLEERGLAREPAPPPGPPALVEICQQAMDPAPERRQPDAAAFAEALRGWLDGARAREAALALVASADAMEPEIRGLWSEARRWLVAAEIRRGALKKGAPLEEKRALWEVEDRAGEARRAARMAEVSHLQRLRAALEQSPGLPEARDRLAAHYRGTHRRALERGDPDGAAEAEAMVRSYDDGPHAAWLAGAGRLTLRTRPAGARVTLRRFEERDRRLIPGAPEDLGAAPLLGVSLPMGSYLLTLEAQGYHPASYPVHLPRLHHWDGVPPGSDRREAAPVPLLPTGSLGGDDVYVPAGWYRSGGVERVQNDILPPRRLWLEGFVIQRFPVTNRQYIAFLDDLVDRGREDRALRCCPRVSSGDDTPAIYGRRSDGHFELVPDADGDLWDPDWPVLHVNFHSARAYADWMAQRTGLPWRLPTEYEWEKAARGVDGRVHPWGDHFEALYCNMRDSEGGPMPAAVDSFPADESPYGVRGMAGNTIDWCQSSYLATGAPVDQRGRPLPEGAADAEAIRVARGGAWSYNTRACRLDYRLHVAPATRRSVQGFRLCRSLDGD